MQKGKNLNKRQIRSVTIKTPATQADKLLDPDL